MVMVEEYVDETVLPVVDESTLLTEKPRFENSANRSLWNCTAPGHGTGGSQSRSSCPRSWEVDRVIWEQSNDFKSSLYSVFELSDDQMTFPIS